ncbi:MAG: thioredoxin family protein [Vicinamibacterales bacterium]
MADTESRSPAPTLPLDLAAYVARGLSFDQYVGEIDRLVESGRTSGPDQLPALVDYTRLNRQRMRRLVATVTLAPDTVAVVGAAKVDWVWLVITEAWCGDSAQCLPTVEKIAALNPGVRTRYVWRDENPALMDRYETDGKRVIPKLICLDARTHAEVWTWGPRPTRAMAYFKEMQAQGLPGKARAENMQRWYLADGQQSIQADFRERFQPVPR